MVQVVRIEDLKHGDIIIIEGINDMVSIVTVDEVFYDRITIKEFGGMDFYPPDEDSVVRIGRLHDEPFVALYSERLIVSLTEAWRKSIAASISVQREVSYRVILPDTFSNLNFDSLEEAEDGLKNFGSQDKGSENYAYWESLRLKARIVKVTEFLNPISSNNG